MAYQCDECKHWTADAYKHECRMAALEEIARIAKDAMEQVRDQKTCWPAEVDTLMDALEALDTVGK